MKNPLEEALTVRRLSSPCVAVARSFVYSSFHIGFNRERFTIVRPLEWWIMLDHYMVENDRDYLTLYSVGDKKD